MVVARTSAYEYWDAPCRAVMKCSEGAWTSDDTKIIGGSFAVPMHNGDWVAADTSVMSVKKATASTDVIIGQLFSEPQGEHATSARYATVMLLGTSVKEIEIDPAMTDTISVGDNVRLTASGGYFGEGLFNRIAKSVASTSITLSNGTFALGTAGPTCTTGTVIPVMFGFRAGGV
jgi:hypothetical protein